MTGFEPQISGIGSDRSTNWATTTALVEISHIKESACLAKVSKFSPNLPV